VWEGGNVRAGCVCVFSMWLYNMQLRNIFDSFINLVKINEITCSYLSNHSLAHNAYIIFCSQLIKFC